jgi:hypothetical protein
MSRIMIEDLPEIQDLCEAELQEIYGAGRPVRRKSRESFPGIVHLELLERREVFSASAMQPLLQAPTADSVAVEMQGSRVEKDAGGNTVFTQSANGSVVAKAVFSPAGQIVSYERAQGNVWVTASFQNGKLSTVTSTKAGVSVIRQEFGTDGVLTKETQFDSKGKKALETTVNGSTRQVTVYIAGNTARLQTFKMNSSLKKEVMIYEETWNGGKRISQTWNTDNGELKSRWATNSDYRFEVAVVNGIRDERTFFKGVQILHEQYSDQKDLLKALANQMAQEKKAGHIIVNPGQTEQAITAITAKPILRETWGNDGKLIRTESWSYQTFAAPLNVPGAQFYNMILASRQTGTTYSGNRVISEVFSGGVLIERSLTEKGVKIQTEKWNSSGELVWSEVRSGTLIKRSDYKTVTLILGTSKVRETFASFSSYEENGVRTQREWGDLTGIKLREIYAIRNGKPTLSLEERFEGSTRTVQYFLADGSAVKQTFVSGKETRRDIYAKGVLTQMIEFHANGKMKQQRVIDGNQTVIVSFDSAERKTERKIYAGGKLQILQGYVPGSEKPALLQVWDTSGRVIHKTTYAYDLLC